MITVLRQGTSQAQMDNLISWLRGQGLDVHISQGHDYTILGLIGDTSHVDMELLASLDIVESVKRVTEPFKQCNRQFHPEDTVVEVGDVKIGGGNFCMIAGPCSVETEEQIIYVAEQVKAAGVNILRGGAYKPRTSPYAFQGLKLEGLALLEQAKAITGMPICTEIMSPKLVEEFDRRVDVIQVGARNMQNFDLLTELGQTRKPILLKRGLSATISEWLMSAEYIMAAGNPNVILCERGIRTFETYTRNTLDLSAVQAVKRLSHLPVIVDPSHATGLNWMVERMSLAAIAAGADGLIIEVHNNPPKALCDGAQSLTPDQYAQLVGKISALAPIVERTL